MSMTCQECQPLAIDLARGVPPFDVGGAVQRNDVLSHIARCKHCAEWLKEQEALSEALRAAAAADASLSAPPSVEANVMAAWRARQAQSRQTHWPQTQSRQTLSPQPQQTHSRTAWRPSAFAAAAAIVLLALSLASLRWLNAPAAGVDTNNLDANGAGTNSASNSSNAGTGNTAGAATSSPRPARPGDAASESGGARVAGHSEGTNAAVVEVLPDKGTGKRTKGRPPTSRVTVRQAAATRGLNPARGASATGGASEFSERAFVLLPYVEPLRPTEMRHIMRVRMPRTQFEAGATQASGVDGATVLADVLVGEDGTARAVRIVQ